MSGLFITIEGTDGAGKTTQIKLLEKYLKDKGYNVVCTREPGGTPISEKIREIIIDKNNSEMTDITEALLYAASRAQHTSQVILPALNDGGIVISDRYLDSSIVYQGFARGMGDKLIKGINKYAVGELEPDITFFLRLKPDDSIDRKEKQTELDRIESEKAGFHQRVYDGYVRLSKRYRDRIKVIDALDSIENIHERIVMDIEELLDKSSI